MCIRDRGTPVYFVFAGCGVVYSKNGNTIRRHDHSFYHMNQFDGAYFMDEGEPRIYGGYGLFTSKNIITRYDTLEREWFVINTNNIPPPSGIKNILLKNNHFYYVFDGLKGTSNQFSAMDNIWRLDLKSSKWEKIGQLNPAIKCMKRFSRNNDDYSMRNSGFSCFSNMIISYDLDKLRFKKYLVSSSGLYINIINIGSLYLVHKKSSEPFSYIEISDGSFLKRLKCIEGEMLVNEPSSSSKNIFILIIIIITTLFILYIRKGKHRKKNDRKVTLKSDLNVSFDEFNQNERELIRLLLLNQESGLEISFINDLVNHDQPSIDTLKKRREILLKDLRYKLASRYNLSPREVLFERRMETDKRMKLFFLNDFIFSNFLD
jgi:hypothetical protein